MLNKAEPNYYGRLSSGRRSKSFVMVARETKNSCRTPKTDTP